MKKMSYIGIGVIIGLLVSFSASAYASELSALVGKKVGSVWSVELNGEQVTDAVIIEGRSYAPVRALSEALGLDVDFTDGKVILNDAPVTSERSEAAKEEAEKLDNSARIAEIDSQIALAEYSINASLYAIDYAKKSGAATEEYVNSMQKVITDNGALIEKLKAEKAALESK